MLYISCTYHNYNFTLFVLSCANDLIKDMKKQRGITAITYLGFKYCQTLHLKFWLRKYSLYIIESTF